MLSRSAGHAHSWQAGVGMRALCPVLGADTGHVRRAWGWALDMSAGLGAGRWTCPPGLGRSAGHVRWSGWGARWVVDMLSRSAGHAHSWQAGVGIRALCPFLGAGTGHVRRAWGWALDMSAGLGAGRWTCPLVRLGKRGWVVDMLSRSAGHAHSWQAGVGIRALCPVLGAGAGHVRRAWGWGWARGRDAGTCPLGPEGNREERQPWSAALPPVPAAPRRSTASRGPACSARTAAAFPLCPRQPGRKRSFRKPKPSSSLREGRLGS